MSPEKLLLLGLLVALVFGAKGVPTIARRAGKGIRDTREALGLDEIREGVGDVRSTFTETRKLLPSAEDGAAKQEAGLPATEAPPKEQGPPGHPTTRPPAAP